MGRMSDLHMEMQESGLLDDPDNYTQEQCKGCDICGGAIEPEGDWLEGHNAAPIVEGGRCCTDCNLTFVIPIRILRLKNKSI